MVRRIDSGRERVWVQIPAQPLKMPEVLCESSSCQHLDDMDDDNDDDVPMLGEKGDLQKKGLRQAPGAKPSSDTSLLCDLGQVTALL